MWRNPPRSMTLAPTGQRSNRKPIAHRLAERGQIGRNAIDVLRALLVPAEPSDHLVEDEERPVGGAALAEAGQEPGVGFHGGGRLQNDRSDPTGVALEHLVHAARGR